MASLLTHSFLFSVEDLIMHKQHNAAEQFLTHIYGQIRYTGTVSYTGTAKIAGLPQMLIAELATVLLIY